MHLNPVILTILKLSSLHFTQCHIDIQWYTQSITNNVLYFTEVNE